MSLLLTFCLRQNLKANLDIPDTDKKTLSSVNSGALKSQMDILHNGEDLYQLALKDIGIS